MVDTIRINLSFTSLSFAFRPYSYLLISCYDFFLCIIVQSEMGVDDLGLEDEIEPSLEDDIPEDEEHTGRIEELNKDLSPGYEAREQKILIP